ncbi:MAG: motif [Thermoleophilaceae bacterium]|jgi:hypothetical protein|nr:motif [Thermoleophilaceae bacterium]
MPSTATASKKIDFRDAFPEELLDELWLAEPDALRRTAELVVALPQMDVFEVIFVEGQLNLLALSIDCVPGWAVYDDPERPGHPLVGFTLPEGMLGFTPEAIGEAGDGDARAIELGRRLSEMAFMAYMAASLRQPSVKVGRNDPCPCGAPLKHKRCCGR